MYKRIRIMKKVSNDTIRIQYSVIQFFFKPLHR